MSTQGDWWERNLGEYRADGRADADNGEFDPPHQMSDGDPQDEAENHAYKQGFDERRKELGEKFQWNN